MASRPRPALSAADLDELRSMLAEADSDRCDPPTASEGQVRRTTFVDRLVLEFS
jgi:hypothetical protein